MRKLHGGGITAKDLIGTNNLPLKSPICTFLFAHSICNSISQRENAHLGDFSLVSQELQMGRKQVIMKVLYYNLSSKVF